MLRSMMYVTTSGSFFRIRISSAASPMRTKSFDSKSAVQSSAESLSPARALSSIGWIFSLISKNFYQTYNIASGNMALLSIGAKQLSDMAKRGSKKVSFESAMTLVGSGWHFLPVDAEYAEALGFEGKSRRVVCTLNGAHTFQCALMPSGGSFFIMVNKKIRTSLGIEAGHAVRVELMKDTSKYGLPMPEEFEEVLAQDDEGRELFEARS